MVELNHSYLPFPVPACKGLARHNLTYKSPGCDYWASHLPHLRNRRKIWRLKLGEGDEEETPSLRSAGNG